jgi:hypothetical protein
MKPESVERGQNVVRSTINVCPRILLVEDERAVRALFDRHLEEDGYHVTGHQKPSRRAGGLDHQPVHRGAVLYSLSRWMGERRCERRINQVADAVQCFLTPATR